jgi:hypothetical protein
MDEQPVPRSDAWPWNAAPWRHHGNARRMFVSLHILEGIRECCTQCGEMIFADHIGCLVMLQSAGKRVRLHFHQSCYIRWERSEYADSNVN